MEAEVVGRQAVLTLSRAEVVLLLSVITTLEGSPISDIVYQDQVGYSRAEVWKYAKQLGDIAQAIPYVRGEGLH
ncbi:hypothetical protein [Lentzea sp. NPDC004782]|uniref:hypothetical protein n=1 Tax=Lentzea sp. NPDC004782 TaxID=3154458 RepID=UPI0033B2477E